MTEREAGGPGVQDDTSTDRPIENPFGKTAEASKGALARGGHPKFLRPGARIQSIAP
jgi:hypothetical protein